MYWGNHLLTFTTGRLPWERDARVKSLTPIVLFASQFKPVRYIVLFPRKGKPGQPMVVYQDKDYSGPPDHVWRERPLCSLLYFSIS